MVGAWECILQHSGSDSDSESDWGHRRTAIDLCKNLNCKYISKNKTW